MSLLASLALILSISFSPVLLNNTSALANIFHRKCVQILPSHVKEHAALSSLLCGEKITDVNLKEKLQKTSLIHIFVVSGAHLLVIDQLLSILKIPVFVRFFILSIYSLATGWEPPAVRALLTMLVRGLLRRLRLYFPDDLEVLLAGFVTLALFPPWWSSLSFLMSWCASLALCSSSLLPTKSAVKKVVLTQVSIFVFMLAPLWGLGPLHPLGMIYNIVLAPLVTFALMPLGALTVLIPSTGFLFDEAVQVFRLSIMNLSDPITEKGGLLLSTPSLWLWILFLHVFFHFVRLKLFQGKDRA